MSSLIGRISRVTPRSERGEPEPAAGPPLGRAVRLQQARLVAEVARRVRSPADPLPPGNVGLVLFGLWREAAYWALSAASEEEDGSGDVAAAWDRADPELLAGAAGGQAFVPAFRNLLLADPAVAGFMENAPAPHAAVSRLDELVRGLLYRLEGPARRLSRRRFWRRARIGMLALLAAGIVWVALATITARADLAAGKPYRTSSVNRPCVEQAACGNAYFHTREEDGPWIEYDLGGPASVRRVEVTNRSDCCLDRVAPLVIESSQDQKTWTELARQERAFGVWTARFGETTARYIRLRVLRRSILHLEKVAIR